MNVGTYSLAPGIKKMAGPSQYSSNPSTIP
jgi:hypothetical protein